MKKKEEHIIKSHELRLELMEDIKNANIEKLDHYKNVWYQLHSLSDELGIARRHPGDPLRAIKNHTLSTNSMCCLMAEVGGMDMIMSHYQAEKYAVMIENVANINELFDIYQDFLSVYLDPNNRGVIPSNLKLSDQIDIYIKRFFMNEISVESIANNFYLSREHISRVYHEEKGQTINFRMNQLRIAEASNLLEKTELSITEISDIVGYSSSQYFSKVFKKYKEQSPKEYRIKNHKNAQINY